MIGRAVEARTSPDTVPVSFTLTWPAEIDELLGAPAEIALGTF